MSSSKKQKKQNESEGDRLSQDGNPKDTLNAAQRDATMVRRWYPLSWLFRLLTALGLVFILICISLAYMMGTDGGTQFMIEKIINQTGVSLDYGEGNLRDGLSVSNVNWSDETTTVKVDKGYVKIGWRALFNEEFHLSDADIDNILIIDSEEPSGNAFSYQDIRLPYNAHLDHANIDSIVYQKKGLSDLVFKDIDANNIKWQGTKLNVGKGKLSYSDSLSNLDANSKLDANIVDIKDLQGNIDFTGDYPLDADAHVTVIGLDKAYFGSIDIEASGSLKNTHGKITSIYNDKYKVTGKIDAQPLTEGVPFSAVLKWKKAKLPYATQHDIWLKSSTINVDGTYKNINVTVDSTLKAKGIPSGNYHAKTRIDIFGSEFHVDKLTADNKKGQLVGNGLFNWKDDFFMDVSVRSSDYDLVGIIPEQYEGYSQYQGYLPDRLNGAIDFSYQNKNAQGNLQMDATLSQIGAETVEAEITELNNHDNDSKNKNTDKNKSNPWQIKANWQDFYRKINPKLDEHLVGIIDSEHGNLDMLITDNKLDVSINANVHQVSAAPEGEYQLELSSVGRTIDIRSLAYQGVVGGFTGEAQVVLPTKSEPLSWHIDGIADEVKPNLYHKKIPLELVNGKLLVDGIIDVNEQKKSLLNTPFKKPQNIQTHQINVKKSDVTLLMTDEYEKRAIAFKGDGGVLFNLNSDSLILQDDFRAHFEGLLTTADVPEGEFKILVKSKPDKDGNLYDFDFEKIEYQGQQGKLDATGKLGLKDAIAWDVQANFQKLNMGFVLPDNPAIVTGKLNTKGNYVQEVSANEVATDTKKTKSAKSTVKPAHLDGFAVTFDGTAETEKLPSGNMHIDISGVNSNEIVIHKIQHKGETGFIDVTGNLNLNNGYDWTVKGEMDSFNLGYFNKDLPTSITGNIDSTGTWHTKNNSLEKFTVKFDGDVKTDKLPSGKLVIEASADTKNNKPQNPHSTEIIIKQFKHQGDAGSLNAKGKVSLNNVINTGVKNNVKSGVKNSVDSGVNNGKNNSSNTSVQWQLDTQMENFNLSYFMSDVPSNLSGNVNTSGTWNDKQQLIDIKGINLTGKLKEKDLTAKGQALARLRLPKDMDGFLKTINGNKPSQVYQKTNKLIDELKIQDFMVTWGDNYLMVNGDKQNLKTQMNITDLDTLSKGLKGKISGGINIKNDTTNDIQGSNQNKLPTLYVDLVAKQIELPDLQLADGHIQGKILQLGEDASLLTLTAKNLTVSNQSFEKIDLRFKGTENSHKLNLSFDNNQVGFSGIFDGGFGNNDSQSISQVSNQIGNQVKKQPSKKIAKQKNSQLNRWQGLLASGKVTTDEIKLFQLQPAQMVLDINNASLNLASHCWQANKTDKKPNHSDKSNQSKLCFNDNLSVSQNAGNVDISLQQIDTSLIAMVMPKEVDWKAKVNGKANISWQKGSEPNISGTLFTDNGKIGLIQEDDSRSYIPYRRISLIALTTPQGLKVRTDIKSEGSSQGYAELTIDPYAGGKPIKGNLVLNQLNLAMFKPFFPGMRILEGEGSMIATIKGKLQKPLIYGSLTLQDGRMSMLGLPINLSKINATATIAGTHANLDGNFNSGNGKGKMSGTLDWQGDIQTKLSLTGEQLEIAQPPLISAKINPDINIIVKPNQNYMEITGAVSIPSATLRPPEANEEIVTKSRDVDVFDRRTVDNINEVLAISKPWSINANIGIDLGSDVNFRGFGAELPLAGAIVMTQRGQDDMRAKGVIQVSRSSNIDAFGQSLELKYAQIRFNGKLQEPNISINAAKTIDNTTVGLRVKGNAVDPKIIVYNDSGLSEQQAMNALVTGRLSTKAANQVSEEGFRSEVTNNLAAAGLSIGLNPTRDWTNQLGRAVGLQSLSLSANASGKTDDTNVNVTGYITPDLYIRYGFGVFNAQSELSFRYQLTRRFYVEATSSTEKFVDLVYSWQF